MATLLLVWFSTIALNLLSIPAKPGRRPAGWLESQENSFTISAEPLFATWFVLAFLSA